VAKSGDMTDIPTGFLLPHKSIGTPEISVKLLRIVIKSVTRFIYPPTQLVPTAVMSSLQSSLTDSFTFGNKTPVQLEQEALWTPENTWPLNDQTNDCQTSNPTRISDHTGRTIFTVLILL